MKAKFNKLFTLLTILTLAVGQAWGADVTIFSVDFSDAVWASHATICEGSTAEETVEGILFRSNDNSKYYSVADGALTFCNNNIGDKYYFLIHLEDVNGSVNVRFGTVSNSQRISYKWFEQTARPTSSSSATATAGSINTNKEIALDYTMTGTGSDLWLMVGRQGSGQATVIKTITITTPGAACAAGDPGNISKGALSAGVLTLNAAGSPESGDTWYWQTAEDGEDDTYSGTSFNVSAAGTYYIRSYNTAGNCWSDAKSITITSTDLVENYTVVYKDGSTTLNSEVVAVGDHPAGIADPTKDCYSFAGWLNGSTPVADVTALSGAANEEIELTATWTPVYSSSATLISDENVSAKANVNTIFAASNIVSSITFTSGNYEFTSNVTKPGYYGYKDKQSGDYMKIMLQQGKRVQVLFGNLGADPTITVNGAAQSLDASRATGDNAENTFTYTATAADALIVITMGSGTNTLKKVDILQLYTATYIDDENGNSSENNVAQVTLGTPTGSKTFMGWKADQAVTVDDEVVAANTTIAGGKTAVLSANTTFTAQWSDAAFTVTYYDGATELGSENVVSGGNPVNYADYQTKAMATFDGWYSDSELNTPIADISALTITANTPVYGKWTSTDARLSAIEFSSNAGTLSPAFNPEVVNYTYTMPYKTADIPTITGATSVNANAQAPVIGGAATAWGESQTVSGKAQSGDTKTYTITMQVAPKDGVSLIKVATTGGTNKTVTGLYAGDGDVNLSSSKKMDNGKYIGFILDGTTLQAGDRINVHTTTAANTGGSHIIFYDNMTDKNELYETGEIGGAGDNIFTINAAMVGATTAYVYRSNADAAHQWNGYVDFIEVTRPMNPMLTAITINGEAGVIDESLKTVTVELQPGYDLAALTIVPTIVSNTDEALVVKTVTSNEGNWVLGPNTYRLTDKDGDYTEYTITLTAGALKHTVTFDAQGGSAVDPQQVVDGENPVVPTAPTKDDYIFQGWSETTDGAVVDVTTFTINAPKTFYAIWASDGAIKLLDGSTVNHTNFITAVTADETVEFKGNTVNYAKFAGTVSSVSGVKDLTRVIAYNATTTQTKIQISAHNNSTNARSILVKGVVEGSTDVTDIATVALGNKEDKVTEYYEFNNDVANRTIYIIVPNSAGDVFFTQVKVIESGAALPMAGQAGYALNLNKGRVFGLGSGDPIAFEGLNIEQLESDYQPTSSNPLKLYPNKSISFTVTSNVLLSLNSTSNKIYYVTKDAAGTDNPTEKTGVSEFALDAGTWYITAGAEKLQLTNIAFSAPKCAEPSFASLTNSDICAGDPYVALDGTATVADAGVPTYQWYNADGDVELVGETGATYTPSAEGSYYVIATNHLAGFADNAKQSATVTVTTFASANITSAPLNQRGTAGDDATLTVAATGKNLSYQWFTCDNEAGDNPTVMAGEENASLTVTIPSGTQWYKVVVSSDCGNVEATAKVEEFIPATPQNVTESTTWDWKSTTAGFPTENSSIDFANTSVEELLANVSSLMPNNDAFHSDMLYGIGQRAWRKSNNDGECGFQGFQLRFHTEVAGRVRVYFRAPSSGQTSVVRINGNEAGSRGNSWGWSQYVFVDANTDVVIAMTNGETGMTRVQKLEFQTPDYTRTEMLGNGVLGTICLPNNVPAGAAIGATFYELAGKEATYGKIVFDQVTELEAGVPYVFQAHGDRIDFFYGETSVTVPDNSGALKGTFTATTIENTDPNWANIYYFAKTALWSCADLTSLSLPANRAYLVMSEVGDASPSPAPGRIRMTLNVNGAPAVVTGMEEITNDQSQMTNKVIIDGHLYILRGEKMYDATGRLVK